MTTANSKLNQSKPKHRKIILTKKLLENLLLAETEINELPNGFRGMLILQGEQPHQSANIKLELLQ